MMLSSIAEIQQGFPFRSRIESEVGGSVAVVQARDLGPDGLVKIETAARIGQQPGASKGLLRPGDVILQPRGTRFSVAAFEEADVIAIAAAPLFILRTVRDKIIPEFLVALLASPATQAFLRQAAVGTYVPQVPRQAIADLNLELPDLDTQAKLVDLVRLERREAELMGRLRDARGRFFDLALRVVVKKSRKRANAPGFKPDPAGARTPRGPLST